MSLLILRRQKLLAIIFSPLKFVHSLKKHDEKLIFESQTIMEMC